MNAAPTGGLNHAVEINVGASLMTPFECDPCGVLNHALDINVGASLMTPFECARAA